MKKLQLRLRDKWEAKELLRRYQEARCFSSQLFKISFLYPLNAPTFHFSKLCPNSNAPTFHHAYQLMHYCHCHQLFDFQKSASTRIPQFFEFSKFAQLECPKFFIFKNLPQLLQCHLFIKVSLLWFQIPQTTTPKLTLKNVMQISQTRARDQNKLQQGEKASVGASKHQWGVQTSGQGETNVTRGTK